MNSGHFSNRPEICVSFMSVELIWQQVLDWRLDSSGMCRYTYIPAIPYLNLFSSYFVYSSIYFDFTTLPWKLILYVCSLNISFHELSFILQLHNITELLSHITSVQLILTSIYICTVHRFQYTWLLPHLTRVQYPRQCIPCRRGIASKSEDNFRNDPPAFYRLHPRIPHHSTVRPE